jgi:hypothetical protein
MRDAGWLFVPEEDRDPQQLAEVCLKAEYDGPFEFIFYCYYSFPTDFPEHISKIFGKEYFKEFIEPEAKEDFKETLQNTSPEAVVTFNKGIFNLVAVDQVKTYLDRLKGGEMVQSWIRGIDRDAPIFLTYPTGWRYHKQYRELRKASLENIKIAILA